MSPLHAKPDGMAQEVFEGIAVAQRLRAELGVDDIDPVPCMLELAEERLGLDVVLAPLTGGVSGFYLPVVAAPVVVVEQTHPVQRQRFTIAHEVGHHALGHAAAPRIHGEAPAPEVPQAPSDEPALSAVSSTSEPATPSSGEPAANAHHYKPRRAPNDEERSANAFAGELLIPHAGAKRVLPDWVGEPPLDLAMRLSAHYGASAFSAVVRLQALALVDWRGSRELRAQLAEGAHLERYAALALTPLDDQLQRHADAGGGPRCSPRARRAVAMLRAEFDALA